MPCPQRRARNRATKLALCCLLALTAGASSTYRLAHADTQSCTDNVGGLEIDGNLVTDTPGQLDWFLPSSGGTVGDGFLQRSPTCGTAYPDAIFDPLRLKPLTIHNMVRDDCDAQGNKDSSVFGSTSDKNNSCLVIGEAPWNCKTGDIPQKNDLTEAYAAVWQDKRTLVNGAPNPTLNHLFLGVAVAHRSTDGDNHIDFEYNQQGLSDCINGLITGPSPATDATGGRTVGDFVVSVDFTGGGSSGGVAVHLWQADASATCGYSYAPVTGGLGVLGKACENSDIATDPHNKNDVTVEAPCSAWQPTSSCVLGSLYHENQFIEAAVDLDVAGITNKLICGSNSTLIIKSRSSQEFTAELKDFVKFPFQILKPPALAPSGGSVCAGTSVQLCVNASGGNPPLGYTWSTGENTSCITVSPASTTTYTVTVTDAGGCSVTGSATATINQSPTVSITNVCAGAQLCASATPPTGATISSYAWSGGGTTQCITPVAGTYTVTVTDSRGCTGSASGTVYPNPTVSIDNVCAGAQLCANATAPTGATISTYHWSNSASTQCITPVAGTYSVTVTDSRGCTGSASGTVNPNPTVSVTNVCAGSQLCANATAPTGTTISTYAWSSGEGTQCISPLAGTYTVTVTDSRGCSGSASGTVYPNPTVSVSDVCLGSQLCANATAPTGATIASYAWSNGGNTQCITPGAGTYTVTVTDSRGCSGSASGTVNPSLPVSIDNVCAGSQLCANATPASGTTIASYAWSNGGNTQCITPGAGTYTVTVTDSRGCSGTASGTVYPNPTVSITNVCAGAQLCANATAPTGATIASYSWSSGDATQCISASAGTYTVTVTDSRGCSGSASGTVYPNPTVSVSDVCLGSQLCANATAPTGATIASYAWSNGGNTQCITPGAGTYTVTVTDSRGCSGSASGTVNPGLPVSITNVCAGAQLCANATPASGTTIASYAWSNGGDTQCITPSAGTYTVTVTDSRGCSGTASGTVYPNPTVSITNVCAGAQLCANATAPTGTTIASYAWSNGGGTQCITPGAGTYTVTVTDSRGCSGSASGTVYPNPTVSVSDVCLGSQLCANATAPTGATISSYAWSNGGNTQCITPGAGTYTVTVTDSRGCTGSGSGTVFPSLPVSITNVCAGAQLCANATPASGTTIASYAWSTGATTQCITPSAGTYSVTVTDSRGCSGTASGTVYPNPTVSITSVCPGAQLCANATPPTGATIASYAWNTGATTQCITPGTGTYSVTVTDSRGCTGSASGSVFDKPTVTVNSGTFCPATGTLQLCATATPPTGATIASYAWNNGGTTQCINVSAGGTYTVTVTDSRGCSASGSGVATESCPNGCTPGFWCGGVGIKMWNTTPDPQWPGPATSCGGNPPFTESDLFTSFFASTPSVVGKTMTDLLCTGGGSDPAQKTARDVIAACLNGCSGIGYPYTCDQIKALWQGALDGTGQYNLAQLHLLLAAANQGGCPFGQVKSVATEVQGGNDATPGVTQSAPNAPGSELDRLELYRPMPNPFASSTRVVYAVPSGGAGVEVGVFDLSGRKIRSLASGSMSSGRHAVTWDGLNESGVRVKNGMYFIHTSVGGQRRTISVVLLK